jgi:hypothetical protein
MDASLGRSELLQSRDYMEMSVIKSLFIVGVDDGKEVLIAVIGNFHCLPVTVA